MDAVMGMQMAQFQTNYTFGLMKMAMDDMESQAQGGLASYAWQS